MTDKGINAQVESTTELDIDDTGVAKYEATADDDVALKLVKDASHASLTPEQAKKVVRKIDFYLMPLLMITAGLQYLDKILLSGASQFGIIEDLHLYKVAGFNPKTHQPILDLHRYSNATLIFYWGALTACKWPLL